MKKLISVTLILSVSACASPRAGFLSGAAAGGVASGGTGTLLSPNPESRGLNALVFGLVGALAGGLLGLLFSGRQDGKVSLQDREQNRGDARFYSVPIQSGLPAFVKDRIQPPVVEELTEPDSVAEDGALHEPHKVYRIERNAELFANPSTKEGNP